MSETLVCSAHDGVQPVYSVHARHSSQFQTEHSDILQAWTVDIPRDAVQIGVQRSAGSGPARSTRFVVDVVGAEMVAHVHVDHKRPRLAARAGQGGHGQGRGQALVSKPKCSSRRFRQHCLPFHPGLGCHPTPVPTARLSHQTPAFPPKSFPQRQQPCPSYCVSVDMPCR